MSERTTKPTLQWPEVEYPEGPKNLGIDTEYSPDGTLLTLGFASVDKAASVEGNVEASCGAIEDAEWISGHNIMGDIDYLVKLKVAKPAWIEGRNVIDTLLIARMIDENKGKGCYGLEEVLRSYFEVKGWKEKTVTVSKTDATKWPVEDRKERCRLDAWATIVIAEYLAREVPHKLRTFTHQIAATLHRITLAGACVDMTAFEEMGSSLYQVVEHKKSLLKTEAAKLGIEDFTPTKDNDLRILLYDKLKLPVTKKTKKTHKAAVDQRTIQKFSDKEVVKTLLEFNKSHKLLSTWYGTVGSKRQSLKQMITPYQESQMESANLSSLGWLPFHVNPLGARTGRRASEKPNSQNWPKSVRKIIVSRWSGGKIGAFDYKSLEPFILAWLSNDEKLFEYFSKRGGYIAIAKSLLGKEVAKGTQDYVVVKSVFLATTYNQLPYTLALSLDEKLGVRLSSDWETHVAKCGDLINKLLGMFPGVRAFMQARRSEVERTGQVVSATGRVRHLPYPKSSDYETAKEWIRAKKRVENQAINYPVQSFAADVTGSALIDVETVLCAKYGITTLDLHHRLLMKDYPRMPLLINEVHDEVTIDMPDDRDMGLICGTMREVKTLRKLCPSFDLPLEIEATIGKAWGVQDGG